MVHIVLVNGVQMGVSPAFREGFHSKSLSGGDMKVFTYDTVVELEPLPGLVLHCRPFLHSGRTPCGSTPANKRAPYCRRLPSPSWCPCLPLSWPLYLTVFPSSLSLCSLCLSVCPSALGISLSRPCPVPPSASFDAFHYQNLPWHRRGLTGHTHAQLIAQQLRRRRC